MHLHRLEGFGTPNPYACPDAQGVTLGLVIEPLWGSLLMGYWNLFGLGLCSGCPSRRDVASIAQGFNPGYGGSGLPSRC